MSDFTIVAPVNDGQKYAECLHSSPCVWKDEIEVIKQTGYRNISQAYNDALERVKTQYVIFAHQDVFLPEDFMSQLIDQIARLRLEFSGTDTRWSMLGVAGVDHLGVRYGNLISSGEPWQHDTMNLPHVVQTLDECLLVCKTASINFDENMPTAHFYGADACLERNGFCYAIDAPIEHRRTLAPNIMDYGFFMGAGYIYRKWWRKCPIYTTCCKIDRNDGVMEMEV